MTVTWSNGSLTASASGLSQTFITTREKITSGKYYWEIKINQSGLVFIGVLLDGISTLSGNTQVSTYQRSFSSNGFIRNGSVSTNKIYGSSFGDGDIVSVLLDMDNGRIGFRVNGQSYGVAFDDLAGKAVYPHFTNASSSGKTSIVTANFGATPFAYELPSGYTSLGFSELGVILHENEFKIFHPKVNASAGENKVPEMTSETTPSGIVTYSSAYASRVGYLAFTEDITTYTNCWQTSGVTGTLQYEFPSVEKITAYAVSCLKLENTYMSKTWSLYGTNDNINYTLIDDQVNLSWVPGERKVFLLDEPVSFKAYKLSVRDSVGGIYLRVGRLEFLGEGIPEQPSYWEVVEGIEDGFNMNDFNTLFGYKEKSLSKELKNKRILLNKGIKSIK